MDGSDEHPAGAPSLYQELGVRAFINAAGTYTKLGGSRMLPAVTVAMAEAARQFVAIDELQVQVGAQLAALTRNEGAYVTCGAAAGLYLAVAACMAGADRARIWQLPDTRGMPRRVVIYRAHRNPYDYAVRALPVELVEVGFPNEVGPPHGWELEAALGLETAAVLYVAGGWTAPGALPLLDVLDIAHARRVPVIVDAAAQLPPRENLWRFSEMGADLTIFSGGKDLRGPQSTGLIVGRRDLIEACRLVGAPNHGIGRMLKVGREELVGLLVAVRLYLAHDEQARAQRAERLVDLIALQVSRPGIQVQRSFPNEAGQPLPRALITFTGGHAHLARDRLVHLLRKGRPSIEVGLAGTDGVYINPMTLDPVEEEPLLARLGAALAEIGEESYDSAPA